MTLVFATNNNHKLSEVRVIVPSDVRLLSLRDIGLNHELPETGTTIEHNSHEKAEYVYRWISSHSDDIKANTGIEDNLYCFADDTGMQIASLNGEPGVYTARYAGEPIDNNRNMDKVLRLLEGKTDRSACFRTVITLFDADGSYRQFEGRIDGEIATEKHGERGFGYDRIFIPHIGANTLTFAQMTEKEKNSISHRARAMKKLEQYLTSFFK